MLEISFYLAIDATYKGFEVFKTFFEEDFKFVLEQKAWGPEFVLIQLEFNCFPKK